MPAGASAAGIVSPITGARTMSVSAARLNVPPGGGVSVTVDRDPSPWSSLVSPAPAESVVSDGSPGRSVGAPGRGAGSAPGRSPGGARAGSMGPGGSPVGESPGRQPGSPYGAGSMGTWGCASIVGTIGCARDVVASFAPDPPRAAAVCVRVVPAARSRVVRGPLKSLERDDAPPPELLRAPADAMPGGAESVERPGGEPFVPDKPVAGSGAGRSLTLGAPSRVGANLRVRPSAPWADGRGWGTTVLSMSGRGAERSTRCTPPPRADAPGPSERMVGSPRTEFVGPVGPLRPVVPGSGPALNDP